MAFDFGPDVTGYISENEFDLIAKTVLNTDLAAEMETRVGLKGDTVKIPLLAGDFVTADGTNCGFDGANNDTVITQVQMDIANRKYNAVYCPQTLRDTFLSQSLAAGAMGSNESIPFAELMADYFVKNLKAYNETFIIQGEGAIEGLGDKIVEANGAALQGGTIEAWTTGNAIAQAQALALAIPDAVADRDDLIMVVSPSAHRIYKLAVAQENLYHYGPEDTVFVAGTNVRLVSAQGLSGAYADVKFAGPASMLILGSDLTSDYEQFKLFYAEAEDEMRAIMRWRIGVAVTQIDMFATTVAAA
jgi:hypothetical protein